MAKYDPNQSLMANAARGVDITEPLPSEIDLTDSPMRTPDQLTEAINEYLSDTYGVVPSAYGLEIKLTDIDWEE